MPERIEFGVTPPPKHERTYMEREGSCPDCGHREHESRRCYWSDGHGGCQCGAPKEEGE